MMEQDIEQYFDRLWPICRSITGNGLRTSFRILQEIIPLELEEVPTGTEVFDWKVPREWNINDAYIITPEGEKIAAFKVNNLHVVNYSTPIDREMTWEELEPHLHTLPDQPTAIPYITSYYKEHWGFCLAHEQYEQLSKTGAYKVHIDSSLEAGSLTYGHLYLPGESKEEVMFSSYLCHPSMANNELSGPLVLAFLYQQIKALPNRKYSYRFVLAPETIGVIAFLSKFGDDLLTHLKAGYVLTCCGDDAPFTYKHSKREDTLADKAAMHVLKYRGNDFKSRPFAIGGSDERQYCSPGFNLPVGSLMRTPYKDYKEYHTSLDDKSFISFSALAGTVEMYTNIVKTIELNEQYTGEVQHCEPFLSKRDLYPSIGAWVDKKGFPLKLLHFLSYADGIMDLIDIAEKQGLCALDYAEVIDVARNAGLIKPPAHG